MHDMFVFINVTGYRYHYLGHCGGNWNMSSNRTQKYYN